MTILRDTVFSNPTEGERVFQFSEDVAACFDDMVERSIPLYREVQTLTRELAQTAVVPDSSVYDIGCSTGTTLLSLILQCPYSSVRFIGLDSSGPMLERCRGKLRRGGCDSRAELIETKIEDAAFTNASAVICLYTLQFAAPNSRKEIVKRIYDALTPNGIFILAEKVRFDDEATAREMERLYYNFKRANGYSETEIAEKKKALDGFLVPFSREENIELLTQSGFPSVETVLQRFAFTTFVARK